MNHVPPGIVNSHVPPGLMNLVKEAQQMAHRSEGRQAMLLEKVAIGAIVLTGLVSAVHVAKELMRMLDRPGRDHDHGHRYGHGR